MKINNKVYYASAKPTKDLLALFDYAAKLEITGLGRAEIYERALRYFVENEKVIDFNSVSKRHKLEYEGNLPSSFKVRINDYQLDLKVNEILRKKFNINRIMTPFKMKVVLSAYIIFLEGVNNTNETILSMKDSDLDSLRIKAISTIIKLNKNQLTSLISMLEGESL